MPAAKNRMSIGPLRGANSMRVADRTLQGTFMRGGYNVEPHDGEWWSRGGETATNAVRIASTPWWWVISVNEELKVIANPWWALAFSVSSGVTNLYTPAVTENVTFTQNSASATSTTTRVQDQLILVSGSGFTRDCYRVKNSPGSTAVTLDRPFEPTSGTYSCRFIDPLARNTAGTAQTYSLTNAQIAQGSAVVFEQLVSHTATDLYAASPTLTGGNLHLVITSNYGVPVAIDLSAYIAGSVVGVRRLWFYNTALGSSAAVIGSDTMSDGIYTRGVYASVYKGRLFIGAASDANGKYGSRTLWYSQIGDIGRWHTGIAGQTAAPNFKTFDGEGNAIGAVLPLGDSIVVHRQDSQEVGNATQSLSQPFTFASVQEGGGLRTTEQTYQTNRVVPVGRAHFMWTLLGLAVFDGSQVRQIGEQWRDALAAYNMLYNLQTILHVAHDQTRKRIYWFSGQLTRHPDALPATATVTNAAGSQYQNYITCFVYDYEHNEGWFEDRPYSIGSGMIQNGSGLTKLRTLMLSRPDGTILSMYENLGENYADPSHTAPETSGSDVKVNAHVETPWLDFGNPAVKQLTEVEVAVRNPAAVGEGGIDRGSPATGNYWLRCRVFGDLNRVTSRGDVGVAYAYDNSLLATAVDYNQAPVGLLTFTPRAHGVLMKLVFSNALTSSASSAGYVQAPFRISDVVVEYAQTESKLPRLILNAASISE